jgi:threonine dehydratase
MESLLTPWVERIDEASNRIYTLAEPTPLVAVQDEDVAFDSAQVFLKLEHLQKTGSFKLRGATNKVLSFSPEQASRGVVASSTGNHGLGVATAAKHRDVDAEVYVSRQVSAKKLQLIEDAGARIQHAGNNPLEAEIAARAAAGRSGRVYISPYNDPEVIAGQGTVATELLEQLKPIDAIYVSVGGGGLISGIGAYCKTVSPATKIVACWPENSRVMYECLRAGRIITFPEQPTLSESTAGGVEVGSITFGLCQRVIDQTVLVSEVEILDAMRWAHKKGWPMEGAGAVAVAAYVKKAHRHRDQNVVIVSCGGNTSPEVLHAL